MKKLKCILILLIIISLFQFAFITTSFGESKSNSTSITTSSPSCILMESSTGKILYEKNAYDIRYPASTTKIMTAILTLEKCKLTDVATVSKNAINSIPADYVTCSIVEGEQLTIEQLLNVLLIPSANDAAVVLAEHIAGSVKDFSNLMNEKAKEIGCKNTHFVNPNGIHNKNHVSTSYDLALIAQYAMKNSTFRSIVKKTEYTLPATNKYSKTDRTFKTTNELLPKDTTKSKTNYYYPDATGVKTGYTEDAGSCLVSSAKRGNLEFICVVLGGGITKDGISEKFTDSIKLFNYAFDNYSMKILNEKNSTLQEVKVSGATKETKNLKVLVKDDVSVFVANSDDITGLQPQVEIEKLKAPISAGSTVGKITYTIDDKTYSSELIAKSDVLPSNTLSMILHICLIIVTLYLIYLLLKSKGDGNNSKTNIKNGKTKSGKRFGKYRYTNITNYML